jgi:hypothetical protein
MCYLAYTQDGGRCRKKQVRQSFYGEGIVSNVFTIPPRTDALRHLRVDYTLTYLPPTKQWQWAFIMRVETPLYGVKDSYAEAMADARRHIELSQGVALCR